MCWKEKQIATRNVAVSYNFRRVIRDIRRYIAIEISEFVNNNIYGVFFSFAYMFFSCFFRKKKKKKHNKQNQKRAIFFSTTQKRMCSNCMCKYKYLQQAILYKAYIVCLEKKTKESKNQTENFSKTLWNGVTQQKRKILSVWWFCNKGKRVKAAYVVLYFITWQDQVLS